MMPRSPEISSTNSSTTSREKHCERAENRTEKLTDDGADENEGYVSSRLQVAAPKEVPSSPAAVNQTSLGKSYEPSDYDVVCGRGKGSYNRPGNRRFRDIIISFMDEYVGAPSKLDKSCLLNTIIERVREQNNGTGKFVKQDRTGQWCEIGDELAREKVGHAMREAVSARNAAEKKRREQEGSQQQDFERKAGDLLSQQKSLFENMMKKKKASASASSSKRRHQSAAETSQSTASPTSYAPPSLEDLASVAASTVAI